MRQFVIYCDIPCPRTWMLSTQFHIVQISLSIRIHSFSQNIMPIFQPDEFTIFWSSQGDLEMSNIKWQSNSSVLHTFICISLKTSMRVSLALTTACPYRSLQSRLNSRISRGPWARLGYLTMVKTGVKWTWENIWKIQPNGLKCWWEFCSKVSDKR